jgi:hypothetical protein
MMGHFAAAYYTRAEPAWQTHERRLRLPGTPVFAML